MSEDFDVKQRIKNIYERWRSENNRKFSDNKHLTSKTISKFGVKGGFIGRTFLNVYR
jgi:hypothetical protein